MEFVYFGFAYLLLAISIVNFFTIRTPAGTQTISDAITVLLPVRNEEDNIVGCIESLRTQIGVSDLRVIIIDDESLDRTKELAFSAISGDSRFTVIDSGGPRAGWLGKVSALQTGLEKADSSYFVTLDADVKLEASALVTSINLMNKMKIDFLSPYPRQLASTISEKLVQPLLHWSWMTTVILRLAEKFPRASTAVANGQLFIVRAHALKYIGGFSSVSNQILDDIELARSLIRAGFRGTVAEGSDIAQTRMYRNFSEIRQGYGKSLYKAFGGAIGAVFAIAFLAITGVFPILLLISGSPLGWLIYASIVITRMLSDTRGKSDSFFALLHPISSLILMYLILYSWCMRGKVEWKGRLV